MLVSHTESVALIQCLLVSDEESCKDMPILWITLYRCSLRFSGAGFSIPSGSECSEPKQMSRLTEAKYLPHNTETAPVSGLGLYVGQREAWSKVT
jgi:hypothetical protein